MDISKGALIVFALILAAIIACIIFLFVAKKTGPSGAPGPQGPPSYDTHIERVIIRSISQEDADILISQQDPITGETVGVILYAQQSAAPNAANQVFTTLRSSFVVDFQEIASPNFETFTFSFNCPESIPLPTAEAIANSHLLGSAYLQNDESTTENRIYSLGTFASANVIGNSFVLSCRQLAFDNPPENNIWKFQFQLSYMTANVV